MKVLAIGVLNLRRLFRDRNNIFMVLAVPFLMIFVIGLLFGGGQQLRLGVVAGSGELTDSLLRSLGQGDRIQVERLASAEELRSRVERGQLHAGLTVPPGYDADLRQGKDITLSYLVRPNDRRAQDVGVWLRSVVPQEAAKVRAARLGAEEGVPFERGLAIAREVTVPGVSVQATTAGNAQYPPGFSQFSVSAPPLLLLFVFLTSLTAAVGLVETRQLGVAGRMYATPTSTRTIVTGEASGRMVIALVQGLVIMLGSALAFGVDWGDPLASGVLLLLFAMVGSGAAMLLGSVAKTVGTALSMAPLLGLGIAAIGGAMVPLESFNPTMKQIAYLTPHAWGYDAFVVLLRREGTVLDILPQLGVLAAFAVVLYLLGAWRLKRVLTSAR
ncbi:ABC-2 type transport system permease protein [Crossiella equi]|uniref:ABC-2 type transport system permease protein n=1 Tax=Crossiella equi TaxID=130796 RepID=A0ABS5AAB1_9PSEU|nr:ABC transporter permease [Crossiella equi]MBP2473519.1 ABC-2 type transport system permease protein [Crossiella equi]